MFEKNQALKELSEKLYKEPWFDGVEIDNFGRIIIYTKYKDISIINTVPETWKDRAVLTHFSAYKNCNIDKYLNTMSLINPIEAINEEIDYCLEYISIDELIDMFYEKHDQDNATTNLSVKYPLIKNKISKLYDEYGFDVLLEQLEAR